MAIRIFVWAIVGVFVFVAARGGALLNAAMGPWTAVGIEQDGSAARPAFGQNLPRPPFIPLYPGAVVMQASELTAARMPSGFGTLDIGTHADFAQVRDFYRDHLRAAGFQVTDNGIAPLSEPTAALLGVAGNLSAKRPETDDRVDVVIRTPDGTAPSRVVQLRWSKLSESTPQP